MLYSEAKLKGLDAQRTKIFLNFFTIRQKWYYSYVASPLQESLIFGWMEGTEQAKFIQAHHHQVVLLVKSVC
jgi:hypothetical protein